MKLKFLFIIILVINLSYQAFSQNSTGKISGVVRDPQNKALAAATITLQNERDTTLKQYTVAGDNGAFVFKNLHNDNYTVICSHIGFQTYQLPRLSLDAAHHAIILPVIVLLPSGSQTLKEVVITSKKPLIEQRIDRTVVNVDAMISAAGSNTLEVLAKTPGVFVDANGDIQLNGQGNVLLLIDDRPTYLPAKDLAAYLRSLPAGLLDKIELMSNPPARYDASGSAVINLQLKKTRTAGFNGALNLGYSQGAYGRSFDVFNFNYRTKKINIFGNLSYSRDANYTNDNGNRYFYAVNGGLTSSLSLNSLYTNSSDGYNLRTGLDYIASPNTTVGLMLTGNIRPSSDLFNYSGIQYNPAMQPDTLTKGYTKGNYHWKNGGANLNFQHKFNPAGGALTANLDYIGYQSDGSRLSPNFVYLPDANLAGSNVILNQSPSDINIYAAKADYALPLRGNLELGAGLKSSFVNTDNQNNWFNQAGASFIPDYSNTNHFIYKENINSAYLSAKKEWRRWGAQGGLRMENTEATGRQKGNIAVSDSSFSKGYTNLFPTLFFSHKLDSAGNNALALSYSVRVRRPNYQQLDPFIFYQNQYTYTAGNPYLDPHYNHILQLRYSYKQYFGITAAYYHVDHIIYSITQNRGNIFVTRPENFGTNYSFNFIAYANVSPVKGWDVNANLVIYNLTNKGDAFGQIINENHTTGEIELSNQFSFRYGWSAELNYFYHGNGNGGQSTSSPIWTSSAGIQKKIWHDKGTVRLKADDIFHSLTNRQVITVDQASYIHNTQSDTRLAGLSLSYRFGKDASARKQNNTGSAEDEKGRTN